MRNYVNLSHPGVPGPPMPRLFINVIFFLGFFFFFDLTDPIPGNAFPAMLNGKNGDGLN